MINSHGVGAEAPTASLLPGGAHGAANVDLKFVRNEERNVRNSRIRREDGLHHHQLDHGQNPGAHKEHEALRRSSEGLMLHEGCCCFRPSFASPFTSTLS